MKKTIFQLAVLFAIASCTKKEVTPEPEPTKDPITAIDVLNTNSGFLSVFDSAYALGGINNQNSIGVNDFTIETNNKLNISYYTEEGTQQSPLRTQYRCTKDLISNQFFAQPSNVNQYPLNISISFDKVIYQYFPYTNVFCSSALKYGGFGLGNGSSYNNDINALASSPNPIGNPDFCFRYPVNNSGAFFGYFSGLTSGSILSIGSDFAMYRAGIGSQANINYYKACLHEVYTTNSGTNNYYAIGITADSVKVYQINFSSFGNASNYPVYTTTLVTALPTNMDFASTTRHYSTDGNTLSFVCTETTTQKISTYIYNFATNTLTQNLHQVTLDYSGAGSDIDLDENGDVYYTGYASNGTNTNGVSVYKKSGSSPSVLVGGDNILLYGTVIKLRVLMGKVFLAVTGKQTGKDVYQISLIKQN